MADRILDMLKNEHFMLVEPDKLRKLKQSNDIVIEAEYDTHMSIVGDPNLITVFRFANGLESINATGTEVFLVQEEEADTKQKIWRKVEKEDIKAFVEDRMEAYNDLWEGG